MDGKHLKECYTVEEVAKIIGMTGQRIRQLCAQSVREGSGGCSKGEEGWLINRDFVGDLLLERMERKAARLGASGSTHELQLSAELLAASARELTAALVDGTAQLRRRICEVEIERDGLITENRKLRERLREMEDRNGEPHPGTQTGTPVAGTSPVRGSRERVRKVREDGPTRAGRTDAPDARRPTGDCYRRVRRLDDRPG